MRVSSVKTVLIATTVRLMTVVSLSRNPLALLLPIDPSAFRFEKLPIDPSAFRFGKLPTDPSAFRFEKLPSNMTLQSFIKFKSEIDLTKVSLLTAREQGWDSNYTSRVTEEYIRFLYIVIHKKVVGVPSDDVDKIWHNHILDTEKYTADCKKLMNGYIHHSPSYTLKDRENLVIPATQFHKAYNATFGIIAPSDIWTNKSDCVPCSGNGED